MFRVEHTPRLFRARGVRYALPAAFAAATVLALLLLWDIARERPGRQQLVVLGLLVFVLTLTGAGLFFVYRAYSTLDWPLKITSPGPMSAQSEVFDAGSAITIKVDDSKFAGWAN